MNWLNELAEVPMVLVISAGKMRATLEIGGVSAVGVQFDHSLCIGIELASYDRNASPEWPMRVSLALASSVHTLDDGLQSENGRWLLWRRYESGPDAMKSTRLEQQIIDHLAVVRFLKKSITPDNVPKKVVIGSVV